MKKIVLLLPLLFCFMSACEVEFTPNAEWKEIPVVYCILDQDLDTTWVRVERCFLAEGNMYDYGTISDSINYPVGSIRVVLCAYSNGQCIDTIVCRDTLCDRVEGNFSNLAQPLYFTTASLDENYMYKLLITRVSNGNVLAYTDSIPLILQKPSSNGILIRKPSNTDRFGFFQRSGTDAVCYIEWYVLENARRYQPIVRFYYLEEGDTHYVDLHCNTVTESPLRPQTQSTLYSRESFRASICSLLKDDTLPKRSLNKVDLYLTACSEDLNAYISSLNVNSNNAVDQGSEAYTNIHNGKGVFASRRTQLYKSLRADSSVVPNVGLVWYLRSYGIGF